MRPSIRALIALLLACASFGATAAAPLTVFAASSLKETLDEAGALYARTYDTPVRVAYGASSALARQIADGAPADVFVSADADWMDVLQRQHLIDAASRRDVAGNALVLVAPAGTGAAAIDLRTGAALRAALGRDGRLAVARTDAVPAGRYARAALGTLGLWTALRPRLIETDNVRSALRLVARGEAPLGIVYASDARAEPRVRIVGRFAASTHPRIVYPAARVIDSRQRRAADFVAWLRSPVAQAVFRRHGFLPAH